MRTRTMKKERRPLVRRTIKAKKKQKYSDVLKVAEECLRKVNSKLVPDLTASCCSSTKSNKKCKKELGSTYGGDSCSSFIRDKKDASNDKLILRHPKCPDQFQIIRSINDSKNKWTVVAKTTIKNGTAFGPFMGTVVMTSDKALVEKLKDFERSRTCFEIAKDNNEYTFFDGSKSNNWMPHIRTASNDFNCVIFLSENKEGDYRLYYKSIRDISPDEEVVVNNKGIINPDQYAGQIAKGIRENKKQLDMKKRMMIKRGKEMQRDMLRKTKEMERLLSRKEKALKDQKTIGSEGLYEEAELKDMEALGREMVQRGKEIEQMFNKSEAGSSRSLKVPSVRSRQPTPVRVPSVSSRQPTPVKKVVNKNLSIKDKKADSVSSSRLSNTSKAKSESKKCSKDFCPCFEAMKPAAKKEESSSDGSSDDSDSLKVNHLMTQISQELAEDLSSEESQTSEDQSSFNNDGKPDDISTEVTEETHTISSVGEVSAKPESSSSSESSESSGSSRSPNTSDLIEKSENGSSEDESSGHAGSEKSEDESQTDDFDDLFCTDACNNEKQKEENPNEVADLTSEMNRQIDVIKTRSRNTSNVLVSRFGFDITGKKIQNFFGTDWNLDNSDIINFYLTMIRNRSRDNSSMNMVQFLYTDFFNALVNEEPTHTWTEHCDIYSCDILFIPAKREYHWTLIAVDCVKKTITSYCYEKMEHPEVPKVVVEFLEHQHRWKRGRKLDFDEWKMDHQHRYRNGGGFNESAAYICTQAEFLSRNMELDYNGDEKVIKTMVYEVVNAKLIRDDFEPRVHRSFTEKCPTKRAEIAEIPPLSPQQQMTYDLLMREQQYPNHSLVKKFGFNITSEKAHEFLSAESYCHLDGLINFYFILIRNRAHDNSRMPMVQFLYTDFYKALTNEEPTHYWTEHCDINSCDYLFIPAKRENKWTLIAVDCVHKSITSYSLCQLRNSDVPEPLKEFLEHQHKWKRGKKLNLSEWEVDSHVCEVSSNYQHGLGDTAAYVCIIGDLLSRNLAPDFDRKKLELVKKTMILEIMGAKLFRNGFVEKEHRDFSTPIPSNLKGSQLAESLANMSSQKKRRRIEMLKKEVRRSRSRSRSRSVGSKR